MNNLIIWVGSVIAGGALATGVTLGGTQALVNAGSGDSVDQNTMTLYSK
ncbi:MAG: hypothetical protein ACR2K3_11145 [Nocardioides sp.]